MFVIQIKEYAESWKDLEPIVSFDDTFYDTYKSAMDAVHELALSYVDSYIDKDQHYCCDMIPTKSYDARIINSLNETAYDFVIMELIRKLPE